MTKPTLPDNLPKSYLTEAEQADLKQRFEEGKISFRGYCLGHANRAKNIDNDDNFWAWLTQLDTPAHTLMYLKKRRGANWIRAKGFNTIRADERYGQEWLDE